MKATARGRPSVGRKLAACCEVRRNRDDSSNPTASTGVDRYQTGTCQTPVFWRLARLEKRLDFRCATRNATPQAPCTELHGRYRTPKQLGRNAKNPGETFGFAAERTGTELFDVFPMFLKSSRDGDKSLRSQKTMHRTGNLFSITEQSEQRHH